MLWYQAARGTTMRCTVTNLWRLLMVMGMLCSCEPSPPAESPEGTCRLTPPPSAPPLTSTGHWLTDNTGRVVILHGVNIATKTASATPLTAGFSQEDVDLLVDNGFNTVRLIVSWESIEPEPGRIDRDYLDEMSIAYRMLADAGIFVLIDMHQDMWGPKYGGNGHPEWTNVDDDMPAEPDSGFPLNYFVMPALQRAFDSFWANKAPAASPSRGLLDHYAAVWRTVATAFAGDPHLLGYDIMNEPWPGSIVETGPEQDQVLAAFHQKVADAIRTVDAERIVWYEPWLLFALALPGSTFDHPALNDPATGMSFHNYCPSGAGANPDFDPASYNDELCRSSAERVFERAVEHHERSDPSTALLLSEFGATNYYPEIAGMVELADRYMISWQYWFHCAHCQFMTDPREGERAADSPAIVLDMRRPLEGDNIDDSKLDVLVRSFPVAVSGTPISYEFDAASRVFKLRYSTARADGTGSFSPASVTEVFLPARHYANGYSVTVEGAKVIPSSDPQRLYLGCSTDGEVSLTVEPTLAKGTASSDQ
jgi:endoglycosylceramidase